MIETSPATLGTQITPLPLPGGGGSGGGGYVGGGYPSWYSSMWAFVDWVRSIPIGRVTVEVQFEFED